MIPILNQSLFWDIHVEDIDPVKHKKWLIERVVQWGTLDDIRALLKIYSVEDISQIVELSRTIDCKTKELWRVMGRGRNSG
ncbi:hypothetical protein CEB3_c35880 [Peptococcaceae bacterium CEB3]|nr:hypothetical protein CEB3_c35880 [Peptococcaceae bacterium CEB3]